MVTTVSRSLWRIRPIFSFFFFSHHFPFSSLENPVNPGGRGTSTPIWKLFATSSSGVSGAVAPEGAGTVVVNIGTTLPVVDTVPAEPELVDKVEADPLIYFKSTNGSEDI